MTAPPGVTFRGHTFRTRRTPDDLREVMNHALDVLMAACLEGAPIGIEAQGKALRELCGAILVPDDYVTLFELGRLDDPAVSVPFLREAFPAILRAAALYEDGGGSN